MAAGQLLATIDNPTLDYNAAGSQADYSSASANITRGARSGRERARRLSGAVATNKSALDEARRVYDADVTLYNNKAIPRNQLDQDQAKLDQAQVAYDQARRASASSAPSRASTATASNTPQAAARKAQIVNAQNQQQVAFTRIVAPFDGTIQTVATQANDALRPLQSGDAVTAGQALFTIAGGGGYIVKAEVDEQDVINVRVGQRANVSGQDFPGRIIRGHVARIAPVATKSTDAIEHGQTSAYDDRARLVAEFPQRRHDRRRRHPHDLRPERHRRAQRRRHEGRQRSRTSSSSTDGIARKRLRRDRKGRRHADAGAVGARARRDDRRGESPGLATGGA